MIIVTGRNAKRFDNISYIIFVLNIVQFITQTSIEKFKADHYPVYFFLSFFLYVLLLLHVYMH